MHTEQDLNVVERFIATYRVRIATILGLTLAVVLNTAWVFVSAAIHVSSPTLDGAVFVIALLASATAALAFYWGAE